MRLRGPDELGPPGQTRTASRVYVAKRVAKPTKKTQRHRVGPPGSAAVADWREEAVLRKPLTAGGTWRTSVESARLRSLQRLPHGLPSAEKPR